MSLYLTIFYLLIIAVSLNETIVMSGGQNEQPISVHRNDEHNENSSQNKTTTLSTAAHPNECEQTDEGNILLITPRTWQVNVLRKFEKINIDSITSGILETVEIRHNSVLVKCNSSSQANELQKIVSECEDLAVERLNFRCHIVSIADVPEDIKYEDIAFIIYAKYHQPARRIRFVRYTPGWKEDTKVALIDVSASLLAEILQSPRIPIQWIEYPINVLLQVDECLEDKAAAQDYSELFREIIEQMKRPCIRIKQISKFSIAEQKSTIQNETDPKFVKPANTHDQTSLAPLRDEIREALSFKTLPEEVLSKKISDSLRETLARVLPMGEKTLLKIVDQSIERALAALRPLIQPNKSDRR